MAPPNLVAQALAEALLAEPASPRRLAARWADVLGLDPTPAWLRRMARRVTGRVASRGREDRRQLVELIARDAGFAIAARGGALTVRRWPVVEAAMQPAPGPPSTWEVPPLATSGDLAAWLGLSAAELDWFAGTEGRSGRTAPGPLAHYRCTWRAKRHGGVRLIEAPKDRLRAIQRRILQEILDRVPPHDAAHGFRRRRSILTHAALHAGAEVVIVLDMASFFPSVRASRVFALFRTLGYPEAVARLLTGLTTCATPAAVWASLPPPRSAAEVGERFRTRRLYRAPHLPQGAPTSPSLANLAAFRLDVRLAAAAGACGARYSRYADDLTFSGGPDLARRAGAFHTMVSAIVLEEGFTVNEHKTRVLRRSVRQVVTGLVVNTRPNLRRDELDRLEAILHNCLRDGPATHNRDGHDDFRAHLAGRVAWVESVNARRGAKLRAMLDRIDWSREVRDLMA